jgi:hypothetical protein
MDRENKKQLDREPDEQADARGSLTAASGSQRHQGDALLHGCYAPTARTRARCVPSPGTPKQGRSTRPPPTRLGRP